MSSRSSGITLMRRTSTPIARSSRVRNEELVSVTLPERISLPMTTMPAVRFMSPSPRSDRYRILAEVAAPELDVHQGGLSRGQGSLEGRANLLRLFDVFSMPAERLDDAIVARVRKRRRRRAIRPVELLLTAADLHPTGVVADDADHLDFLSHHGFELHGMEAERAGSVEDQDVALRARQLGGHGVTRADAERAQRTGIEPLPWLSGLDGVRGGADEVPSVTDDDRVVVDHGVDLAACPQRIDRLGVRPHRGLHLLPLVVLALAESLHPRLRDGFLVAMSLGEIGELRHHDTGVADDADLASAVASQLRAVEVHLDQLGFGIHVRLAPVAKAKVERRAEDDHDVGALQRFLASLLEEVRMTRRQAAACSAVDVDRHAERIDELRVRLAATRPPILAADDGHRSLGGLEQSEGSLDGAGIAGQSRLGTVLAGEHRLGLVHLLEQQIERHL